MVHVRIKSGTFAIRFCTHIEPMRGDSLRHRLSTKLFSVWHAYC